MMLEPNHATHERTSLEGRYRLVSLLGQSEAASVFEAVDTEFDLRVALRIMRKDQVGDPRSFAPRFFDQGARRVRLQSRHTVRVYDYGRTLDDTFFVAREVLTGRPLSFLISDRGPAGDAMAAQIAERICHSLVEAHRFGVLHGQLDPGRVWLTGRGLDGVKVTGFGGLTLLPSQNMSARGLPYASPEHLSGDELTPRTDVYGIGVILLEMLTGRAPFASESPMRIALAQRDGAPCQGVWYDRLCQDHPTLAAIVQRCLSYEPAARYATVNDVRAALMHHLCLQAA